MPTLIFHGPTICINQWRLVLFFRGAANNNQHPCSLSVGLTPCRWRPLAGSCDALCAVPSPPHHLGCGVLGRTCPAVHRCHEWRCACATWAPSHRRPLYIIWHSDGGVYSSSSWVAIAALGVMLGAWLWLDLDPYIFPHLVWASMLFAGCCCCVLHIFLMF